MEPLPNDSRGAYGEQPLDGHDSHPPIALTRAPNMLPLALVLLWALLPWTAPAMRVDRLARLRQDTVDMFYHGWNNYMEHAFPEDEASRRHSNSHAVAKTSF